MRESLWECEMLCKHVLSTFKFSQTFSCVCIRLCKQDAAIFYFFYKIKPTKHHNHHAKQLHNQSERMFTYDQKFTIIKYVNWCSFYNIVDYTKFNRNYWSIKPEKNVFPCLSLFDRISLISVDSTVLEVFSWSKLIVLISPPQNFIQTSRNKAPRKLNQTTRYIEKYQSIW